MTPDDNPEEHDLIRIGHFARLSSLTVKQLRRYDQAGLLPPARIDVLSGHRYYDRAQAATAELIALLRSIDVPLADIQRLLRANQDERHRLLSAHRKVLATRLDQARQMLTILDEVLQEADMAQATTTSCSFCGKPAGLADRMVAGRPGVRICDGCLDLCVQVLVTEESAQVDTRAQAERAFERLTHRAMQALAAARQEADGLGHWYVGTEHLLLALATGTGVAARILADRGVTYESLRQQIAETGRPAPDLNSSQTSEPAAVICGFCGRAQQAVARLIAGPGVYICNECVDTARRGGTGR